MPKLERCSYGLQLSHFTYSPGSEVCLKKFESYAQNGEDIRLNRCFGHQLTGCYIDVGSSEPTRHSVTYALYRAGWRGIAIEPLHDRWSELEAIRPHDINLKIVLADQPGRTSLFRSLGRGGTSTIVSERGKAFKQDPEFTEIEVEVEVEVEVDTLANICSTHLVGVATYELLKSMSKALRISCWQELTSTPADLW